MIRVATGCSILFLLWILAAAPAVAQALPPSPEEAQAREMLSRGRSKEAIPVLKNAIQRDPSRAKPLRFLLADAYMKENNDYWALRTLSEAAAMEPNDPEAPLRMAWVQIRQGALDQARESLEQIDVPAGSPAAARQALLSALVERYAGDASKSGRFLSGARGHSRAYPEDREAIGQLTATDPAYVPVFSGRVDLNGGWASNALTGSPADPSGAEDDTSSLFGNATLWMRFAAPKNDDRQWVRPVLEAQAKGSGYSGENARDLGYAILSARPAVIVGEGAWRALFGYRYESSRILADDKYEEGPLWFYEAHRGEFELEMPHGWMVFGGAGWRKFREIGRSRIEVDGGVAGSIALGARMRMVAAATGRRYLADKDPYHLWGASALVSADARLASGWSFRTGLTVSQDVYPASSGYFDAKQPRLSRRETTIKASGGLYFPPWMRGLQTGCVYEFATRWSRIDAYDYRDHRIFLKAVWSFSSTPALPKEETPPGHVALDYGLGASLMDDRVQDLLRQDESVQRSSSCLD